MSVYMLHFAEVFPDPEIVHALRAQFSLTHLREIVALDAPLKRRFYVELCRREHWSIRTVPLLLALPYPGGDGAFLLAEGFGVDRRDLEGRMTHQFREHVQSAGSLPPCNRTRSRECAWLEPAWAPTVSCNGETTSPGQANTTLKVHRVTVLMC